MDISRSVSPVTFMSNMLYACSILYKTKLPFILVMNKVSKILNCLFINPYPTNFDFSNWSEYFVLIQNWFVIFRYFRQHISFLTVCHIKAISHLQLASYSMIITRCFGLRIFGQKVSFVFDWPCPQLEILHPLLQLIMSTTLNVISIITIEHVHSLKGCSHLAAYSLKQFLLWYWLIQHICSYLLTLISDLEIWTFLRWYNRLIIFSWKIVCDPFAISWWCFIWRRIQPLADMSSLAWKFSPKSKSHSSLCWIWSNCNHSPHWFLIRIAVLSPQIISTMGVDLILAGIYTEEKSLFMEKILPVVIHKNTKKKKAALSIFV